ncbi:hypothetical protein H1230_18745 [Paenibacillus sp. 19GGS1-52]|uniref:hypothetical protein n=1 Tax=Paenibacillus sp. 19GGS1-52 TaxID=2758563 RepID=UPI001EFB07B6|nr:hypothetical protein [Paenibacillus sp. 19GGS1-52]ULO05149.1 hypothetical protein H1230_18745 [Paenibacillus sp. 19GGS1-52]
MSSSNSSLLVDHISKTLPGISEAVNQIVDYLSHEKKFDKGLLEKLALLTTRINWLKLDSKEMDKNTQILYLTYIKGINELYDGSNKFLILIADELNVTSEPFEKIRKTMATQEISMDSAINNLFKGSQNIALVVEEATR